MSDTMTVHVEVTAEDIAAGFRNSCMKCPVALAMNRTLSAVAGREIEVLVVSTGFDAFDGGVRPVWKQRFPAGVAEFIQAFDAADWVQPFAFDLTLTRL